MQKSDFLTRIPSDGEGAGQGVYQRRTHRGMLTIQMFCGNVHPLSKKSIYLAKASEEEIFLQSMSTFSPTNSVLTFQSDILLDANESPFALPPGPREALRELLAAQEFHRYPDPEAKELRRALASRWGVEMENVVVGNGADEILLNLFLAFVRPGDVVLHMTPCFSQYPRLCEIFGAEERLVPVALQQGRFSVREEQLLDAVAASSPKLILLDTPHNPTGITLDADFLRKLGEIAPCPVVIDEAYGEFAVQTVLPDVAARGIPRQAVLLRTLSKAWGLAGLRLGYAVTRPELREKIDAVRNPFHVGVWPQSAAKLLLSFDEWMESRVLSLVYIRDRFVETVNGLAGGWFAAPSEGNFVLVRSPQEKSMVQEELRQSGIRVRFFENLPWEGCWMRVSIGKEEDMRRVVEAFSRMCAESFEEGGTRAECVPA